VRRAGYGSRSGTHLSSGLTVCLRIPVKSVRRRTECGRAVGYGDRSVEECDRRTVGSSGGPIEELHAFVHVGAQ
jgi:hypothetical protein